MSDTQLVYISSTYEDLKAFRLAVIGAVDKLERYKPVAMERYDADPRAALDKCLGDVARCDYYVGLLGARYGSLPEGFDKSFTQLEYEKARALNLACLFFAPASAWRDQDQVEPRARAFRELVSRDRHVVREVADGELGQDVLAALLNDARRKSPLAEVPQRSVPELLPYTCDRVLQCQELQAELMPGDLPGTHNVPVCIIHGRAEQMPDKFEDWLKEGRLRELLVCSQVHQWPFDFPLRTADDDKFEKRLTISLAKAIAQPAHDRAALAARIAAYPAGEKVFFSTGFPHDYFQDDDCARLVALARYFSDWPEARRPAAVLVWVTYKAARDSKLSRWLGRGSRETPQSQAVRSFLGDTARTRGMAITPELADVTEDDALRWAREPSVLGVARRDLGEPVRGLFRDTPAWPMDKLAAQLRQLLATPEKRE